MPSRFSVDEGRPESSRQLLDLKWYTALWTKIARPRQIAPMTTTGLTSGVKTLLAYRNGTNTMIINVM